MAARRKSRSNTAPCLTLFTTARLDSRGGYVVWIEDDLEMAADDLRNLATVQTVGIGHERLANWMAEHGLTQERAADAVGISRRMLSYYLAGSRPIPKIVWLACLGWAAEDKGRLVAAWARGAVSTHGGSPERCRGCGHTSQLRSNLRLRLGGGIRLLSVDSRTAL